MAGFAYIYVTQFSNHETQSSEGSSSPDFDKEVKELKTLLIEAQARLAPYQEITPEMWNMIKQMKKNKS
jgi:hypothetical protein